MKRRADCESLRTQDENHGAATGTAWVPRPSGSGRSKPRRSKDRSLAVAVPILLPLLVSCATLADLSAGDENLPNAAAGPFRDIESTELGQSRVAPHAMIDNEVFFRDLSVVDIDGDPDTLAVYGYFAMTPAPVSGEPSPDALPGAIVRFTALDLRSFDRTPVTVLEPASGWEGNTVGAPSAVRSHDGSIWLYYAAAGGIGLARSTDGALFVRQPDWVLGPDASIWEAGAIPQSPAVVEMWDGTLRMFYEVNLPNGIPAIGEAQSEDGKEWTRAGDGPALLPGKPGPSGEDPYDSAWVGSPGAVVALSSEGEPLLRLYYGARNAEGRAVIAMAARRELFGPLVRAVSPVFGSGSSLGPREPCVIARDELSILFATQKAGRNDNQNYPAVVAAVAPGNAMLPPAYPR